MSSPAEAAPAKPGGRGIAGSLFRAFASLQLAVVLIVVLAAVLAWATFMEAAKGREYTQWYVYSNAWFVSLLGLLGANILACTLIRFPWKRGQVAFVITHTGLLALLGGSILTFVGGMEGQLAFEEGQTADTILKTDRSRITALWQGPKDRFSTEFAFDGGPVDWRPGRILDFGEADGIAVKVMKFYRHARQHASWVENDARCDGPAIRFTLLGPGGNPVQEEWVAAGLFGGETALGPIRVSLQPVSVASMLDDFLKPPAEDPGKAGLLSIHHKDKMWRVPVEENLGKKVPAGDSGAEVEIVRYMPDATPAAGGKFESRGEEPKNPVLELRVFLPDKKEPIRQLAFAKHPLLNLDGVHGSVCPVKFFYHHPAVAARSGVEFIQAPDGKLYCRTGADGKYLQHGEVREGNRIKAAADFELSIAEYLPHARREVEFRPVALAGGETPLEAAALVAVTVDGQSEEFWLQRNDEDLGFQRIDTPKGPMLFTFGYERFPLGFSLKLLDFTRSMNPGRMGDASFASSVQLTDPAENVNERRDISMNQPLVHRKFAFYQSSFQELPNGKEASILTVAYDPGRFLKYLGCAMICLGIFVMSFMKGRASGGFIAWFRKWEADDVPRDDESRQPTDSSAPASHDRPRATKHAIRAVVLLFALGVPLRAAEPSGSFDWNQWRRLPVQDEGRSKPLDTLARETLRTIANRASIPDPNTGQKLDPTAFYLGTLFEWQGERQSPDPHAGVLDEPGGGYFRSHEPDKWDRDPLLRVDFLPLREALGMPAQEKYISPLELSKAAIDDPETGKKTPFMSWANKLFAQRSGFTPFQKKGLELADKYLAYQRNRMGEALSVVPIRGSEHQEWASLDLLMRTSFTDQTDPTGELRKAQTELRNARDAYLKDSPDAFNEASATFLAAVAKLGPTLGAYPSPNAIDLEIAYNRWAPFRFAWVLMLIALVSLLLSMGTRWKTFYAAGLAAFSAGLAVMLVGFGMRIGISGRAPVTNMYESVIYLGLGVAVFGLFFELLYRKKYLLSAAAAVATVALVLADNCPAVLDPSIRPLPPVLRNNFWLTTHVMSITLSYAVFALAMGIGNITLGYCMVRSQNREVVNALSKFTYKSLQVGVLLLAIGTILGGVWADYAWGRFWGWDPKEVWALITLLGYLAVLHARYAGWVRNRGLAALSVICFSLVVMAWYGVNFVLGTGLHTYGFGGGGQNYVFGAVAVEFLYVGIAVLMSVSTQRPGVPSVGEEPIASLARAKVARAEKIAS
jgi:cytochrome c-type biogenesis protein CcsB